MGAYSANKQGIIKIIELINGKLRTDKINNLNYFILNKINIKSTNPLNIYQKYYSSLLNNYWLAGFSDADSSFQIKLLKRSSRKLGFEIRLNFQIDQKIPDMLNQINEIFPGYVGHRKINDTYIYKSSSFASARKVIKYLDDYHLLSHKYIDYLKWRKTYARLMKIKSLNSLLLNPKFNKTINSLSSNSDLVIWRSNLTSTVGYVTKLDPYFVTGFCDAQPYWNLLT